MRRFLAAAVALPCLALLFGGCLVFSVEPSATAPPLGPVVIRATICGSDASEPFTRGCRNNQVFTGDANGNSDADSDEIFAAPGNAIPLQVLLGYRVPTGASPPASFAAGPLRFTLSSSYTAELQRLVPAPAGLRWFGYTSGGFAYDPHRFGQLTQVTAAAPFGLPRNANGTPFAGPFRYRVVVGVRAASATAPVRCGDDPFELVLAGVCVDAPSPGSLGPSLSVPTSDLGIAPGPAVTVRPGSTTTLPFTARYAGSAAATFAVSARTGLPGATATPSVGSLTPADGSANPLSVTVAVPAGAAPGRYPVTLTASIAGRTRSATATIVVPAPPSPPPPPPPPPTPPTPPTPPPTRIESPIENEFVVRGNRTKVLRLRVRSVPRGGVVRVLCRGSGCPFRSRRFTGTAANPGRHFRKRLRTGATIEVRITAPGAIGKAIRYRMRRAKVPRKTRLCLPPGSERPQKRC